MVKRSRIEKILREYGCWDSEDGGGKLLEELEEMADDFRDEIRHLRGYVTTARGSASVLERENKELRAQVERLRVENIQMQAALGYGILAEDERHIIPSNPYRCGTCDARARAALAQQEKADE